MSGFAKLVDNPLRVDGLELEYRLCGGCILCVVVFLKQDC